MKTIILSAGKGERLLPLTKDRPKILVELGDGTTMLSRQYDNLSEQGQFYEIVVGAGHCVGKVEEFVANLGNKIKSSVIYNPFYAMSGPLVTLWVVLNKIDDSNFIFMNGDTIYSKTVYEQMHALIDSSKEGIFLICSTRSDFSQDDVRVRIDENMKLREAGKNIENANAISAGLMMVKGEKWNKLFRGTLEKVARREDFLNHKKTWHSFINDLVEAGIDVEPLLVKTSDWAEVDLHFDLVELQKMLQSKLHFD